MSGVRTRRRGGRRRSANVTLPYTETFTGTTGAPWPSAWTQKVISGTGTGTIQSNAGRLTTSANNYDNVRYDLSMASQGTIEVAGTFQGGSTGEQLVQVFINSSGDTPAGYWEPSTGYMLQVNLGTGEVAIYEMDGSGPYSLGSVTKSLTGTTKYGFRIQRSGSALKARVWAASGSEPGSWDVQVTAGTIYSGIVGVNFGNGPSATSRTMTWDDILVTTSITTVSYIAQDGFTDWSQWTVQNSGTQSIVSGKGRLTTGSSGFASNANAYHSSMAATADQDAYIEFTTDGTSAEQYVVFGVRDGAFGTGSYPTNGYFVEVAETSGAWNLRKGVSGTYTSLGSGSLGALATSATYAIRIRAVGSSIQVKIWNTASAEPGSWTGSYTDSSVASGKVFVSVQNGSAATARSYDFDNLAVVAP